MAQRSTTPRRRPGRPSKLTPEVKERLLQAIRAGNYYDTACAYASIDYSTFRRWITRGEKARSGMYHDFCEAVKKAEYEAEARLVAQWQQHMPGDWKAIATFLERRHPDKWGRRDRVKAEVEHSGQVTERHEYDITHRIEQYADVYEKIATRGSVESFDARNDPGEPLDS